MCLVLQATEIYIEIYWNKVDYNHQVSIHNAIGLVKNPMIDFFKNSEAISYLVTKPLSHIRPNWELTWDNENNCYVSEDDSYADLLNDLISEINITKPTLHYHDYEDVLAEYERTNSNRDIVKVGNRWIGEDYQFILEQGGFRDYNELSLVEAVAGRINAAINFGQNHFDELENGHQMIIGYVLAIILYHRSNN